MTTLVTNKASYEPTADDSLWLLRAVEAEGEPRSLVAASLVSGFMFARERGLEWPLARYIRAYSQPVNPRWFLDGDLYKARVAKEADSGKRADLHKLAVAREFQHSKRAFFSDETREAAQRALSSTPAIPDATDFAAWWVEKAPPWEARTAAVPNTNRLWARPGASGWGGYWTAGGNAVAILLLVAAAAFLTLRA